MNPGRELDALVAEKVFGFERGPDVLPDGPCIRILEGPAKGRFGYPKPYSTSIEAAWEVVGKLRQLNPYGLSLTCYKDMWCIFDSNDSVAGDCLGMAETAPHAIALAALKSIGVNND